MMRKPGPRAALPPALLWAIGLAGLAVVALSAGAMEKEAPATEDPAHEHHHEPATIEINQVSGVGGPDYPLNMRSGKIVGLYGPNYIVETKNGRHEISEQEAREQSALAKQTSNGPTGEKDSCLHYDFPDIPKAAPGVPPEIPPSPTEALPKLDTADSARIGAIAEHARGEEILQAARVRMENVARSAGEDQAYLGSHYQQLSPESFRDRLRNAFESLSEAAQALDLSANEALRASAAYNESDLDRSEKLRFRNLYLNARDKAALALGTLEEGQQRQASLGASSPFAGFLRGNQPNPLSRTKGLQDVFGAPERGPLPTSQDALANRSIMYFGLPRERQAEAEQKLRLLERPTITLPSGQKKSLPILHNGYVFGGGKTSLDCSSFVSSVLPADARKGRFTTLDLRAMWFFQAYGTVPAPPKFPPKHKDFLLKASDAFIPVKFDTTKRLLPGDLLVHRPLFDNSGHVFLVKDYNPATLMAQVYEAAQSAGTVRERPFSLTTYPPSSKIRPVRGGLYVLRLKPTNNRSCSYQEGPAAPAPRLPERRSP